MTNKRRNTSSPEPEGPVRKRRTSSSSAEFVNRFKNNEQPVIDARSGQVGAFPGLVNNSGDELFYGPATNGLDYLRMVRSEARYIPSLLTATPSDDSCNNNRDGDGHHHDGFFGEDEAYIAEPTLAKQPDSTIDKAQQLYYHAVLTHFNLLRTRLKLTPPLSAIQALPESTPISFPSSSRLATKIWEDYIFQHRAHPVQIACMDPESVLGLIRLMTDKMPKCLGLGSEKNTQRMGSWLWAALAKCPERGELGSDEISDLRAFVKAAEATWHTLGDRTGWATDHLSEHDDTESEEEVASAKFEDQVSGIYNGKSRVVLNDSQTLHSSTGGDLYSSGLQETTRPRMILDIILTIVGEIYGQRDLLNLRRPWGLDS